MSNLTRFLRKLFGADMTTVDYSQLTAVTTLNDSDLAAVFPSGGPLKKITIANFRTQLNVAYLPLAGGTMTGALLAAVGTESLPGVSFSGDADSGLYHIGANNLGVAVGGVKVLSVASTGLAVTGATTSTAAAVDVQSTNATTIRAANSAPPAADTTSGGGLLLQTTAAPTAADQRLGTVLYGLTFSGAVRNGAAVQGFSAEAWTPGTAQGTYLTLETTATGAASRTEVMRITANARVGIGTITPATALEVVGGITGTLTGSATSLATGRTIAITGDLAYTSPIFDGTGNVTAAGTLATVNSNVGSFGSASKSVTLTVNAKGLVTAASEATIATGPLSQGFNDQTGAHAPYTLVAGDVNKLVGSSSNIVIPANASVAFATNTVIGVFSTTGAQSILITSDTLNWYKSDGTIQTGTRSLGTGSMAFLMKTGATTWMIFAPNGGIT